MTQPPPDHDPAARPQAWPGQRLGLPEQGARSIARPGRRLAALAVDWLISSAVAYAFFEGHPLALTAIFGALQAVTVPLLNGTIGHLVFGMRVVPLVPGPVGFLRPLIRAALVTVVIPAVIWDADQRGLHDKVAGTLLVKR